MLYLDWCNSIHNSLLAKTLYCYDTVYNYTYLQHGGDNCYMTECIKRSICQLLRQKVFSLSVGCFSRDNVLYFVHTRVQSFNSTQNNYAPSRIDIPTVNKENGVNLKSNPQIRKIPKFLSAHCPAALFGLKWNVQFRIVCICRQ